MYSVGDSFEIKIDEVIDTQDGKLYKIQGFKSLVFDEYGLDKLNQLYTTRSADDDKKDNSSNKDKSTKKDKITKEEEEDWLFNELVKALGFKITL